MQHTTPIGKAVWVLVFLLASQEVMLQETPATDYYVSPTGNDSNIGSESAPWKTIKRATEVLQAGDTAYLRGGTYREDTIAFTNSGTATNPITVMAYPGENPIIDAGYTAPPLDGTRRVIFWINRKSYITLNGLTMTRGISAGVYIGEDSPNAVGIVIKNCTITNIVVNGNTAAVYLSTFTYNAIIQNNILRPETTKTNRGSGIEIFTGGNDHLIENNDISYAVKGIYYKHGAVLGSGNELNSTVVRNNSIHDLFSTAGGEVVGIESSTDRMQIINNLLYAIRGIGIRVYEVAATCDRVGAFYTKISHNTIHSNSVGIGIFSPTASGCTDRGARYSVVTDNLIYKTVIDSIGAYSIWHGTTAGTFGSHGTTSDYNLVYSTNGSNVWRLYGSLYSNVTDWSAALTLDTGIIQDIHSLQAAPLFIDLTSNNYGLAEGSPGKNASSDGKDIGADMTTISPLRGGALAIPPSVTGLVVIVR